MDTRCPQSQVLTSKLTKYWERLILLYINQYTCMSSKMAITKARVNLGAVTQRVFDTGEQVILERDGIPVAAIVNLQELEDLQDSVAMLRARAENADDTWVEWNPKTRTFSK